VSDIAIVGIGEVPTALMPGRTPWDIVFDTCIEAVGDSGIGKDEIQGVISVAPLAQPVIESELAYGQLPERLGLKGVRDSAMVNAGGASTSNALRLAAQWITSGIADSVLVQQVTVHSTMPVAEQIDAFARAGVDMQWEYPYGTTYNIIMGLLATRYMYDSGASPEEMASVVTALRSWAEHDPNSLFYGRPAPSVDQVLSSDMLNTPLHKRESNILADGGAALVVVSAQKARDLGGPAAYKLGESARYFSGTCVGRDLGKVANGLRVTAEEAMARAGVTREDIDLWNVYLAYPLAHPLMAESLGVAPPGQGAHFFAEGRMSFGGDIAWSTIGDAPGRGHTGSGVGTACCVETARQLMGRAGKRQVRDCSYVYQNSAGGSGFNNIATIWGKEA
jgi:acetyl-CoA C-acetyltransferase